MRSKRCAPPSRLADSPSVIVSDEDEPIARMRHMMRGHGPEGACRSRTQRSRSIPTTRSSRSCSQTRRRDKVEDAAWLLFDQALLLEGVPLKDPPASSSV